ncbi:MAG TPA: hypothetical protein VFQ07_02060 [Candidatus Polarisedimenticolia bacterium]|nr:hypothetical protein [Candidatus Polarisedimenticolia bacterium]
MTPSSSADAGPPGIRPGQHRGRAGVPIPALGLGLLLGAATGTAPLAAEGDFVWNTELREIYSQDVQRVGNGGGEDDVISSLTATAEMRFRTPRSESGFGYTPELLKYAQFTEFDHLDHHESAHWLVRLGERSEFQIRQGFSLSSRQVGFADLAGAGGGPGQPVTARTERTVWDLEPHWTFHPRMLHTFQLGALARSESYGGDTTAAPGGFIDSDQFGLQAQYDLPLGRAQTLGGRIKGDRYRFSQDETAIDQGAYDQFFNLGVSWSLRHPGVFDLAGSAGAYRASGQGVDNVLKPTADLAGTWQWFRKALRLGYVLGYSSGGGLTTSEQSQSLSLNYNFTSVQGWFFGSSASTLRRRPLNDALVPGGTVTVTQGGDTVYGYHADVSVGRQWHTGIALSASAGYLHQQESAGGGGINDLHFLEGSLGLRYTPPAPPPRPARPAT